jgi:hypothetical protein
MMSAAIERIWRGSPTLRFALAVAAAARGATRITRQLSEAGLIPARW